MRVRIKKWTGVAVWKWRVGDEDDTCIICRSPFDACCPDCKYPGDDCPPVWGKCDHVYHMHCVVKWLKTQTTETCALCRRPWEFK
jgi:anaphase-promoting complex subunit 11